MKDIRSGYSCCWDTPEQPPKPFNMSEYVIGRAARATPDKIALRILAGLAPSPEDKNWTYAELEDAVLRTAGGLLAAGLKPGDHVMIRLANDARFPIAHFGAIAAGLVSLPVSTQLSGREIEMLAADAEVAAILLDTELPVGLAGASHRLFANADLATIFTGPRITYARTQPDDPAYMVYTSGTSSRPKGVLHAQRAAWGRRPMLRGWYGLGPDDVMLHAGAFNWTYTLGTGLTDPWASGATAVVYMGEKDPALWPAIIRHADASIFAAVPTVYRQILKYGAVGRDSFPRLRHGLTAGESLPPDVESAWFSATGTHLCEAFGMSEISTYLSTSPEELPTPGSPGQPQPGRRVALLPVEEGTEPVPLGETGIIAVHRSDPGMMLGYWRREVETAEAFRDDWFLTGDLATMDAKGHVFPAGRADDVMNPMGYRVSPFEIESVLVEHPFVAEVAVTEVEVRPSVRIIIAFVVPSETAGQQPGDPIAAALLAFAGERLAAYKCPREVRFVEALPRTANGKVTRRALAALQGRQV